MIDIVFKFLQKKIGMKGTLFIAFFCVGFYFALSYPAYIVTPDSLEQAKQSLNNKMDKLSAKNGINIAEMELASLRKEKFDLEDLIDVPKPKHKYLERLKEVNERIKELESDKKDFLKVLELK
jgi:hypothetical protein